MLRLSDHLRSVCLLEQQTKTAQIAIMLHLRSIAASGGRCNDGAMQCNTAWRNALCVAAGAHNTGWQLLNAEADVLLQERRNADHRGLSDN